tara:strand:+ start:8053 stop:9711 length:1659 start_codon:yes stop_codon:yes gene_type:complete
MAINKNFVVKNGLEVSTDLIFADATAVKVGIATTNPQYTLDVYGVLKSNHLNVIGVATITGGLVGDLTGDLTGNVIGNLTGDVTGNSDTATSLETARNIGGVLFDGTEDIDLPGVNTTGNQDITANANTATALQTPRNIGGVSFDGTSDIDLPGVNIVGDQNTTGTAANLSGTPDININDLTASGNISVSGDLSVTGAQVTANNLGVTGISTFNNVTIGSGIITATNSEFPVEYYGDGTHLTNVQRGVSISTQQTSLIENLTLLGNGVKNITLEGAGISTCTLDSATDTATVHVTGSGAFVTVSETKPLGDQKLGDLWYNNKFGKLYLWYDEPKLGIGTASYWVDAAPFDSSILQGNVDIAGNITATGSVNATGSITAASFSGDGSNLSGVDVSNDTTPELGGNLDLNSKDIIGTGNINISGNINNINAVGVSTFNGGLITTEFAEKVNAIGNGGSNMVIDLSNGSHVTATLSEDETTVTFNTGIASDSIGFTLVLTNSGDTQSIIWPSNIKWPGNTIPTRTTASGKTDIWVFVSSDGGANWYGNVAIYNFT